MSRRARPGHVDTGAVLDLEPERARHHEIDEDGLVSLLVPRFDGRILGRYLMPLLKEPFFRIRLDELGSFVWLNCDGTRTGHDIAGLLSEAFPDLDGLRDRLSVFLAHLLAQGHLRVGQADDSNVSGGLGEKDGKEEGQG